MISRNDLKIKYRSYLAGVMVKDFKYFSPVGIFLLSLFIYSDLYILEKPIYSWPRVVTILFLAFMFIIRYSKLKQNLNLVYWFNSLTAMSFVAMGFYTLMVSINTPLFKTAILALIIDTIASFFVAKGKKQIILVYSIPLLVSVIYIAFLIKPNILTLRELLNPFALYISVVTVSLINENARFKAFFYKENLQEQNNEIEMLYEETLAQNTTLEQQKEEILTINDQLQQKSEELTENLEVITSLNQQLKLRNKNITDSINYARRIQDGILPAPELINNLFPEHFLLFLPCQIVSGDFYWLKQVDTVKILAIADCTGHGVPGAFMSLLGNALLNEIVHDNANLPANEMLNSLKEKLSQSLNLHCNNTLLNDGMDIAVVRINTATQTVQYAGAHMPMIVIRNGELNSIAPDLMPIGKYIKEKQSFTNHEFKIDSTDVYYFYSDGYKDQIGGEERKRFLSKNLKNLLLQIHHEPMPLQKQMLLDTLNSWRGNTQQLDDVLVFGFKPL